MISTACCRVALAIACLLFSLGHGVRAQGTPPSPKHLRALLVIDSLDPAIGKSVAKDGENMAEFLRQGFGKKPGLTIDKIAGKQFTREAVEHYFKNLKTGPTETLLFYYAGHGATLARGGHLFAMKNKAGKLVPLFRWQVRQWLLDSGAGLTILLADTCGSYIGPRPEAGRPAGNPDWKVMQALFFQPRGLVDINSVSEGEAATGSPAGGYFTSCLIDILWSKFAFLNERGDGILTWDDIVPLVQVKAQRMYGTYRQDRLEELKEFLKAAPGDQKRRELTEEQKYLDAQKFQTVRVFHLPDQWRLGVRVVEGGEVGVKIACVHAGSPADLAGLKPGDIILKIGEQKVQTPQALLQALEAAGPEITITYRPSGQKNRHIKVKLSPGRRTAWDG